MKFTISSTDLNSRLQALAKVINSKNSLAILDCFLMEVRNNQLIVTASDGENTMKSVVDVAEADADGKFCITSNTILNAVKELPEQPLSFDVNTETKAVKVTYLNGVYNFSSQSADEYPIAQSIGENVVKFTMSSALLVENLTRTLFATAQDELRPVMNGIYFDLREDALAIVASDGHKLVRNKNVNIQTATPASFILPKKPAALLKNVLAKDDSIVEIKFNTNNAEVHFGKGMLSCRLIEGKYPNYDSVIPTNNPNEIRVDRQALISALRHVMPFASESSELIRFDIEKGKLGLRSEDIDFNTSASEDVNCEYNAQPMSIGFKGSSLIEILNNLDGDEITIQLADPSRAGIIVPTEQPENEDVLMLLMPMLLNY